MALTRKSRAATISIVSNSCLVAGKLVVGGLSGSVSIVAEALHSGIDLVAAVIAFFSVRVADQPPDGDHPFGHEKAEPISGAVEALLIVLAALWIVYEAVDRLFTGGAVQMLGLAAGVMGVSALVNAAVARYLLRVAREEDSLALEADGHHLATDVITSLGVAAGLGLVWWTGWQALDAIAALCVAAWIGVIGWKLTRTAARQLMDHGLDEGDLDKIRAILAATPDIHSWHRLQTRKAGAKRHVIVHILCRGDMPLFEAHQVADRIEKQIAQALEPAQVVIHIDAYDPAKLEAALRERDRRGAPGEMAGAPVDTPDRDE
jgi:cation diffusion facilitator family transporter